MAITKLVLRLVTLLFVFSIPFLQSGCGPASSQSGNFNENVYGKGRLSFFLDLQGYNGPHLVMRIASIELLDQQGIWQAAPIKPVTVNAGQVDKGQAFLGRMVLEPGTYKALRLTIQDAAIENDGGQVSPLSLEQPVYEKKFLPPIRLEEGDSQSLFLTWDTKLSLRDTAFVPVMNLQLRQAKLIADTAYVACPEIDTVYMINTATNKIVDSIGIEGGPLYLAVGNETGLRDKIYVLAARTRELVVFSASANNIIERYSLKMLDDISNFTISPDDTWAYVIDKNRGDLVQLDLNSGFIANQIRLNYGPSFITYLPSVNLLAVSLGISQKVVLLNPDTLDELGSISTSPSPEGLAIWQDQLLLVAESGSNTMLVYDVRNSLVLKRVMVDFQPRRILTTDFSVYVANYGDRTLSVIQPGQFDLSRNIHLDGPPLELAEDQQNRWIYIGNEGTRSIDIIESTINDVVGKIELGTKPGGIIVVD